MPRFYITTAIDYVNSRPHLGTAYEKIAADVIARYKRLAGFETRFVMGNDEHSQNVFRKAREQRRGSARVLRSHGARVPRRLEAAGHLLRRLHPHDRTAAQGRRAGARPPDDGRRRHLRRALRGLVLRRRARRSSRRRTSSTALCPIHRTKPEWIREKNYFFRLSKYHAAAARSTSRSTRSSSSRTSAATRSCGCSRAGSRTSRSAAPARRGASRCPTIRRASSTSGSTR